MVCSIWSLIKRSIIRALWSPPRLDCVDMQLAAPSVACLNKERHKRQLQYARALNSGYLKVLVLMIDSTCLAGQASVH